MTAKEMFEEFNFELTESNDNILVYTNKETGDGVHFYLKEKDVWVNHIKTFNTGALEAVYKQLEELGWL